MDPHPPVMIKAGSLVVNTVLLKVLTLVLNVHLVKLPDVKL